MEQTVIIKKTSIHPSKINSVCGDNATQIIEFVVERFSDGVDLSGLVWAVYICNSAGNNDVIIFDDVEIDDDKITMRWYVGGIATAVSGATTYQLKALLNDGDAPVVWTSAKGRIDVADSIQAEPHNFVPELNGVDATIAEVGQMLIRANAVADSIIGMDASAQTLEADAPATVECALGEDGVMHLAIGVPKGDKGEQGDKGDKGEQGDKGDKGDKGADGAKGDTGEKGDTGAQGERGVDGADAPQIADNTINSTNPWSSAKIIDTLCPPFEVSGNPVTCYPVAGSPLNVKARVEPVQHFDWLSREGETTQDGTPSPDAPIPLVDSVPAGSYYVPSTASDGGYWRVDLDAALGGVGGHNDAVEIDAYTGYYRIIRKTSLKILTGAENVTQFSSPDIKYLTISYAVTKPIGLGVATQMCNMFDVVPNETIWGHVWVTLGGYIVFGGAVALFGSSKALQNWLIQQYMSGMPVTIRYAIAEPIITTGQATRVTSTTGLTALNAVSMGLTAPDPDHPCEITVADAVHVQRRGKNLIDTSVIRSITAHGISVQYIPEEDCWLFNGTSTNTFSNYTNLNYPVRLDVGAYYTLSTTFLSGDIHIPDGRHAVFYLGHSDNVNTFSNWTTISVGYQSSKSVIATKRYITRFWFYISEGVEFNNVKAKFQFELGSTPTPYEPCVGDTYDIALPDGFEGGEVNVTGGTVAEEWGKIVLDGGMTFTRHLHSNGMPYIEVNGVSALPTMTSNSGTLFSSHHKQTAWTTASDRIYCPDGVTIIIVDERFTDSAAIQAIYAANPETIYYKRTTPVQQSVTPTPITALTDCNTITTDADTLTVSGRADPIKLITDQAHTITGLTQRISALESATTI